MELDLEHLGVWILFWAPEAILITWVAWFVFKEASRWRQRHKEHLARMVALRFKLADIRGKLNGLRQTKN